MHDVISGRSLAVSKRAPAEGLGEVDDWPVTWPFHGSLLCDFLGGTPVEE